MPTRAQTKAMTREALLLAALTLFATEGLDGPSLDSICEQAGKTRGAFYVHFPTREALNLAVTQRILQDYTSMLAGAPDLNGSIDRFADVLVRASEDDPGLPPFVRLGTRHFHLVLEASARDPSAHTALSQMIDASVALLTEQIRRDPRLNSIEPTGMAEVLVSTLVGLLSFRDGGINRVRRIQATLKALIGESH